MAKYATLKELTEAIAAEREFDVIAFLDNDSVSFYSREDGEVYSDELLELHPSELQEQALDLLGIAHEPV